MSERQTFLICRILGEEQAPRDTPGARLASAAWILQNEPELPRAEKFWLINSVVDQRLQEAYVQLLAAHAAPFAIRPLNPAYDPAAPFNEKVRLGIDINGARNACLLRGGQSPHHFTAVLDGDCFFDLAGWCAAVRRIDYDQTHGQPHRYFSLPSRRMTPGRPDTPISEHLTEAQLIFRNDADMRFDETIPFGAGDKQELLRRLGHVRAHLLGNEDTCVAVGTVFHYAHGDEAEYATAPRIALRQQSLQALVRRWDDFARQRAQTTPPTAA